MMNFTITNLDENSSSAMVELSTKIARDFCAHNRSIEGLSHRKSLISVLKCPEVS